MISSRKTEMNDLVKKESRKPDMIIRVSSDRKTLEWLDRLQNKPKGAQNSEHVLQNLHLDHQYLATPIKPRDNNESAETLAGKAQKKLTVTDTDGVRRKTTGISAKTETRLRSILTGSNDFAEKNLEKTMEILNKRMSTTSAFTTNTDVISDIPNAMSIQNSFQNVLNMTSFRPIQDNSRENSRSRSTECFPSSKVSAMVARVCNGKIQKMKKPVKKIDVKGKNDIKAWKNYRRAKEEEAQFDTLLKYTMKLLLEKWAEYLAFPSEKIREEEIQNAKDMQLADEVIEMLEDKDRYVWQLIDEI